MATTVTPPTSNDPLVELAREVFLTNAGRALVKRVANLLNPRGIPIMPLKGVLLQKLVYAAGPFRSIADVDLLVPERRFFEAVALLEAAGFSRASWERGAWQVTLSNPSGPPLGIDLHRRLTRTVRSRLTAEGMFARGREDTELFDCPIVVPCAEDIFAHLVLHASLHWLRVAKLHRPQDFQNVAEALHLDAGHTAAHLRSQGLIAHGGLILPMIRAVTPAPFIDEVLAHLAPSPRERAAAWIARFLAARSAAGRPGRRIAGLALAPSLSAAALAAARDRLASDRHG